MLKYAYESKMVECSSFSISGLGNGSWWQLEESNVRNCKSAQEKSKTVFDEEIYVSCMKRFLYVRCYDSLELLSSLKVVFVLKYHIVGFVLDFFYPVNKVCIIVPLCCRHCIIGYDYRNRVEVKSECL